MYVEYLFIYYFLNLILSRKKLIIINNKTKIHWQIKIIGTSFYWKIKYGYKC